MSFSNSSTNYGLLDVLLGVSIAFVLNLFVWTALSFFAPEASEQSLFLSFILLGLVALVIGALQKLPFEVTMPVRLGLIIGGIFILFVSYMRWGYHMQDKVVLVALGVALAVLVWLGSRAKH